MSRDLVKVEHEFPRCECGAPLRWSSYTLSYVEHCFPAWLFLREHLTALADALARLEADEQGTP